jgi:hypothetical protein
MPCFPVKALRLDNVRRNATKAPLTTDFSEQSQEPNERMLKCWIGIKA